MMREQDMDVGIIPYTLYLIMAFLGSFVIA